MKNKKVVFKAVLEALVLADIQVQYKMVQNIEISKPEIKNNFHSVGTAHNAISDCYFQAGYCSAIWSSLHCH